MRGTLRAIAIAITATFVAAACGGGAGPGTQATGTPAATAAKPKFELAHYAYGIQTKGKIRIGTREDNIPFGRKDPATNKFEGFDIDIAREIAKGIFGNVADIDQHIEYVPVVSATRIPTLQEGKADFVIATFTINEDRKKQIDFSDVYFNTGQRILVKKDNSTIKEVADLNGKRVCSAKGSTSEVNIRREAPQAILELQDTYPPCLILLQQGRVDAVSTDETILFGLVKQDPNTKIVGRYFSAEPYGIGIKKDTGDRVGFAAFINSQLTAMFSDGRWAKIYKAHITPVSGDEKTKP
ncbi:MAG TPA: glutamate ABC transporter substrate-binding protein [Candidatus Limnocylindria bacterium]|nr:glutamate ABC transporter substrate-binding protein [Candidatus Limnocylindria bacterium]